MSEQFIVGYFIATAIIGIFFFKDAAKRSPSVTAGADALFASLIFGLILPFLLIWLPFGYYEEYKKKKPKQEV